MATFQIILRDFRDLKVEEWLLKHEVNCEYSRKRIQQEWPFPMIIVYQVKIANELDALQFKLTFGEYLVNHALPSQ